MIEELTIRSAGGDYERRAWLVEGRAPSAVHAAARTAGDLHPLCVLLDGEHYLDNVQAVPILEQLIESARIPSMTFVFISNGGNAARHADYVGTAAFARFIADDVVAFVKARVSSVSTERNLIGGLSLSGLAAAHIALLYPSRFSAALCQSGSFWHEPDVFARLAREHAPLRTRFWLSVGDEETATNVSHPPSGIFQGMSQIDGVDRARAALEETGADVHYHRFHGGHAFAPWRDELGDALAWLMRVE